MKATLIAVIVFALLAIGGWAFHHRMATGNASAAAPIAVVEPPRHVAPAGTLTKEQLLSAINKDAKESSLEVILGAPSSRKSTGWSARYEWTGKIDTGGDIPASFAVEVAQYNGIPLVVGIYDPVSGSKTSLPWRTKVAKDYNDTLDAANNAALAAQVAANNSAVAAQNAIYQQAAADINPVSTSVRRYAPRQYVPSSTSYNDYDQPRSTATSAPTETRTANAPTRHELVIHDHGAVTGYGKTKGDAYADAMSLVPNGATTGQKELRAIPFYNGSGPGGGWEYRIETTRDR